MNIILESFSYYYNYYYIVPSTTIDMLLFIFILVSISRLFL